MRVLRRVHRYRTPFIMQMLEPHLAPGQRILNIGAGHCQFEEAATRRGWDVTPLDVQNWSCSDRIEPVIYDGERIPWPDDSFDAATILYVLHHTPDPDKILREARRVAKRVVIAEDIVHGRLHRWFTCAWDSVLNFEYFGHPHTNRTDLRWRETFADMGLRVTDARSPYKWLMHNGWYVLDRDD